MYGRGKFFNFFHIVNSCSTKIMALFYGQNIKCKYITVMLYISMSCCIHQCYVCIHQCHVYINVMFVYINVMYVHQCYVCKRQCHVVYINAISRAYTSVLYAVNRVLNVTNRCCLLHTSFLQCGIKIRHHKFCLRVRCPSIRDRRDHVW